MRSDKYFRFWRVFLAMLILLPIVSIHISADPLASSAHSKAAPAPENHARSAALIDVTSGRTLFSQRGDDRMKIASLTKIMTAIVAIEHGKLDEWVKVTAKAAGKEGSSIFLKAGEKMTLRNLLYGLMLRSGNDAAVAIAEHVGGSVEGFAYLMNKKAEEIGLENSRFMNPHGLDQEGHYSSANDLAKLTAYALHNPDFRSIVKTRVKTAPNPNASWDYKWINKNKMLSMYDGADGVKTGYTRQALRTLVSSATRNGQQLVAVTLNDRDDWADHRRLLDFGFAHFPLQQVVTAVEPVAGYPFEVSRGFRYPFAAGERARLEMQLAPLKAGTPHYKLGYRGQLRFVLDGQVIGSVPLTAVQSKQENSSQRSEPADSPSVSKPSLAASLRATLRALFFEGRL